MNCQEYNRIYQEFKYLQKELEEGIEYLNETGKKPEGFNDLLVKIKEKKKEMIPLLEKYGLEKDPQVMKKVTDKLEELMQKGAQKEYIAQSLTGIDSLEARVMYNKLQNRAEKILARSLAGCNSPEAMVVRKKFQELRILSPELIAQSLTGVKGPEAMAMREELVEENVDKEYIAQSLAGLTSELSFAFREKYFSDDPDIMAKSFVTNDLRFNVVVCSYAY
jgi:ethanolamine ammonia-lyase large subunit